MLYYKHISSLSLVRQNLKGKHTLIIYSEKIPSHYILAIFYGKEKILQKLAYPQKICYTSI